MAETTTRIYELQVRLAQESLTQLRKIKDSTAEIDKQFKKAEDAVKSFGKGLVAGLTVSAVVAFAKSSIDAAAALGDMAAATGASVENLSKLQQVAQVSGVDMETVAASIGHLNTALHENEKGSRNIEAALKAIGLSVKELRDLDPAEAYRRIAVHLDKFADGGGKAAAMTVILGDASSKTASYVKDLAGAGEINAKITAQQAEEADKFNKQLNKMSTEAKSAGQALVRDLIPYLSGLIEWFNEGVRVAGSFWELVVLRGTNPVQALTGNVDSLTKKLAELRAERDKAASGAGGRLGLADVERLDRQIIATEKLLKIEQFRQKQIDDAAAKAAFVGPPEPPGLRDKKKPSLAFRKPEPKVKEDKKKSEFEQMTEALDDQRASMEQAVSLTPQYDKALRRLTESLPKLTAEQERLGWAQVEYIRGLEQSQIAEKKRADSLKDLEDALKDQRTETDKYFVELERLYKLQALYPERALELQIAIAALTDGFLDSQKVTKEVVNENAKLLEAIADKVDGYAKSISSSLVDFMTSAGDAKFSFRDFVTSVLRDLARMTTQMLLVEPIMSKLQASMRQFITGGQYSWQKGLVTPTAAQMSQPMVDAAGAELARRLFGAAKGGVFSSPSLSQYSGGVYDKPQLFKFARGGVFGEAGPEAIMPLKRGPDGALGVATTGGGGDVTINVYNETRAEVKTQAKSDVNGNRIIEVMVKEAVSNGFRSGAFDAVMGTTYGLNRQGAR